MAVKKQPESNSGKLHETTSDWFREFLKHLELFMVGTGQSLAANAVTFDLSLAAMRAVKLTLLESGMDNEQIRHLFGRVAFEDLRVADQLNWNAELNERRFQLIDRDIQGTLSQTEHGHEVPCTCHARMALYYRDKLFHSNELSPLLSLFRKSFLGSIINVY